MHYIKHLTVILPVAIMVACNTSEKQKIKSEISEKIAVKTYKLHQSNQSQSIHCSGILSTENEARYAFKMGGVIDKIFVKEGDFFSKGKLLATLKTTEIDAGLQQARLGLEKAERDLKRIKNLYKDSVATLEQFQNTQTAFEMAQKQLEAIEFNRQYMYIYAAQDGFVTQKLANDGEIVGGGMPILAINENTKQNWILKAGISDKDWVKAEVGNRALVVLDAFPGKSFQGLVMRKSLASNRNGGSFQVDISLNFEDLKPAVGMFGQAVISGSTLQNLPTIPYESLIEADGRHAFVFVPLPDGKVRKQPIEIERFNDENVMVKSGLEGIREIVLSNSAFLNEKSIITIIK